ncbi:MAG: 1,4-dihydroxy-6-naphthoate synthase [Bacteroidetes bacterium CG2_30_33_31]|nr:MAG: 1,4-dihydroxy-6-naphthoate synthase [Bacteroidetes bacterium CG2_30_33_31]
MNQQILTLGFSSCPNDTFIFDALIHHKIDTEGLEFKLFIADVEELNRKAFKAELDISKISFSAYTQLTTNYILLDSGSALGENCGPLLISKKPFDLKDLSNKKIAIPGLNTTANLLISHAFPNANNKVEMLFSNIESAVLNGDVDAGLIIHESRFTYQEKGLHKLMDVGEFWETETNTPTPLGGIIAKRSLDEELLQKVNRVLHRSLEFAFANPKSGLNFIRSHSQEMSEEVMYKHIALYVNNFSLSLGISGRAAVIKLFEVAKQLGKINKIPQNLFLENQSFSNQSFINL